MTKMPSFFLSRLLIRKMRFLVIVAKEQIKQIFNWAVTSKRKSYHFNIVIGWSWRSSGQSDRHIKDFQPFSNCLSRVQAKAAQLLQRRKQAEDLGVSGASHLQTLRQFCRTVDHHQRVFSDGRTILETRKSRNRRNQRKRSQ